MESNALSLLPFGFKDDLVNMIWDLKLAFVIRKTRKFGQLRDGFPSRMVFTTISVIKFTIYIQDFVLKRYCSWGGVSFLVLA